MAELKTAALYIRVSTHMQEELSPDAQKRLLLDYAKEHGFLVPEEFIFIEEGISGRKAEKRPKFQHMIGLAKSKENPIDAILVWKFSRFARNQEESIVYKSLLKKNDVDVISIKEPLIEGPFGQLIERIIEWMDEYYSIRLGDDVFRGMSEKALRGGYQCSPPLGYQIRKGEPPTIVPDEAEIIRIIFTKYAKEGLTAFQVARYLNEHGFKTKSRKNKPGTSFERRSVEYILQNPMYKGYIRWNMFLNSTKKVKDKSEWIVQKGVHEPIVSEELYEKAQTRMQREHIPKKARPSTEYHHWLSGILKCSNCGRTLSASTRSGLTYSYFQCIGYSKGKCTVSHSVSDRKITPIVIAKLKEIITTEDFEYKIVKHEETTDTSVLQTQLKKIDTKEKRIKDAYLAEIDTLEEYRDNKNTLEKERQAILNKIEKITKINAVAHKSDMLEQIKNVYTIITDDKKSPQEKNRAMKTIVEKIIYHKEEASLTIILQYNVTSKS